MTRTGKSPRELESVVEDLEAETPTDDGGNGELFAEEAAKARERWEADDYEPGDTNRIRDAYAVTADGYTWNEAFGITLRCVAFHRNNVLGYLRSYTPDEVHLPEMPNEDVREAWLTYGDEMGIDGHGIHERHGDEWRPWYFEQLYLAMARSQCRRLDRDSTRDIDPDGERGTWALNREKHENEAREWREAMIETVREASP